MAAVAGIVSLDLNVAQSDSLKSKRRIVKGFKDRLASRHNVSVAEVGAQDSLRRAELAIAMVGSDRKYIESALQKIINLAASHRDMILLSHEVEWY